MSLLGGVIGSLASTMFQSLGINRFEGMAKAELILTPLGPTGAPLTLSGVKNFRLQYNPEALDLPKYQADYVEHESIGMVRPVLHYTGSGVDEFPLDFVMVDDADGPPHAFRDAMGNIVYREFQDLLAVWRWLRFLTLPLRETERPPMVHVELGPFSEIGVITKLASRVVRSYPTGFPRVMEVNMNIRPEPVFTDKDTQFFEVK